jgi:hypothetical protein
VGQYESTKTSHPLFHRKKRQLQAVIFVLLSAINKQQQILTRIDGDVSSSI